MRQLVVVTRQEPLLLTLEALADLYDVKVVCPGEFADLVFNNAVALVLDPQCLSAAAWHTYLDYLMELGGEDSTLLVMLMHGEAHDPFMLPERIAGKPEGTLYHCYDDDTAAVSSLIEEALLGTCKQWNLSPRQCTAPGILDVEACYITAHLPDDYVVVVSRPAEDPQACQPSAILPHWQDSISSNGQGLLYLTFSFNDEEDARRFAVRIPAGMATLYTRGQYAEVNCNVGRLNTRLPDLYSRN